MKLSSGGALIASRPLTIVVAYSILHAVLVTGGARALADEWPAYGHDNQHTGFSATKLTPSQLQKVWDAPGMMTPIVVGNRIYAISDVISGQTQTKINAYDAQTGELIWSKTGDYSPFTGTLAYAEGMLVYQASDRATHSGTIYVRDSATGELKYTVATGLFGTEQIPPVLNTDPNTHAVTAYQYHSGILQAINLGGTSGSILWTRSGMSAGSASVPTVAGDSIILAGPGQYYAVNRTTGAVNHFHSSSLSGGGGGTAAYDASRRQFYVLTEYDDIPQDVITAYSYSDNEHISILWQYEGSDVTTANGLALDAAGNIYTARNSLIKIDPNGNLLSTYATPTGKTLSRGIAPVVSDHYVWISAMQSFDASTLVYDLDTGDLATTLDSGRASFNSAYRAIGEVGSDFFITDVPRSGGAQGFSVYRDVPEPIATLIFGPLWCFVLGRRRISSRGQIRGRS
jgi:outer membrane protein assembly factor BamB